MEEIKENVHIYDIRRDMKDTGALRKDAWKKHKIW